MSGGIANYLALGGTFSSVGLWYTRKEWSLSMHTCTTCSCSNLQQWQNRQIWGFQKQRIWCLCQSSYSLNLHNWRTFLQGVSNRWTGIWNGTVEWTMEWTMETTVLGFPLAALNSPVRSFSVSSKYGWEQGYMHVRITNSQQIKFLYLHTDNKLQKRLQWGVPIHSYSYNKWNQLENQPITTNAESVNSWLNSQFS